MKIDGKGKGTGRTASAGELPAGSRPDSGRDVGPAQSARSRRRRRKTDPSRMWGAWVIANNTRDAVERCELFQDIGRDKLMEVAALIEEISLQADEFLLREGDAAKHIFVVVEGHGIAQLKLDRGWISLGLVAPGQVAGWSSLVDGRMYPASVKALTPMRAARIEAGGLTLLMNLEPEIGYPVHRRLSSIFFRQYEAALNAVRTPP